MRSINWKLIARVPASTEIITGGPEYGAFTVAHLPATNTRTEVLLAECGTGLYRRIRLSRDGEPVRWGQSHEVSGSLATYVREKTGMSL